MSIDAMKNIIYRCTNSSECLNILYDPTYSILDTVLFDTINANFYCYNNLAQINRAMTLSDLSVFSYDFILTNTIHKQYNNISNMLHVPIIRYINYEIGPSMQLESNCYYVSEKALGDYNNKIFSIDPIDILAYSSGVKKNKDVCILINYPELIQKNTQTFDMIKEKIPTADIINTIDSPITNIAEYKCVIDTHHTNQYNMLYAISNNVFYISTKGSPASIFNKYESTAFCQTFNETIDKVTDIINNYNNISFENDQNIIRNESKDSNWKNKIQNIVSYVKTQGFIK